MFAADIGNDDTIEDDLVDENDCIFETEYEDELTLDNNDVIMENDYAKYFDNHLTSMTIYINMSLILPTRPMVPIVKSIKYWPTDPVEVAMIPKNGRFLCKYVFSEAQ